MRFSRQEYWSGLPRPPPRDLPKPGIEPVSLTSPALAARFFTTSATWEAPSELELETECRSWVKMISALKGALHLHPNTVGHPLDFESRTNGFSAITQQAWHVSSGELDVSYIFQSWGQTVGLGCVPLGKSTGLVPCVNSYIRLSLWSQILLKQNMCKCSPWIPRKSLTNTILHSSQQELLEGLRDSKGENQANEQRETRSWGRSRCWRKCISTSLQGQLEFPTETSRQLDNSQETESAFTPASSRQLTATPGQLPVKQELPLSILALALSSEFNPETEKSKEGKR